jgi:(2R)-3-sulfolactate dehydrogenase (NADP+)
MANCAAQALVLAEAQGLASHGLARVNQYVTHLRNGRALGAARPKVVNERYATVLVDAGNGLAFEACELAVSEAIGRAKMYGVSFAGVTQSHHAGVLVDHLRPVAAAGMVGIGFATSPAALAAAGGKHPVFGTNPVAAVFPRPAGDPVLIDLSLSEVARGKLMLAAKEGSRIPLGWALDRSGEPTTDPAEGLAGSMLALGAATSAKGAMLAMAVELLATALVGANFGFEASSFFVDKGNRPGLGQAFLVIDPAATIGRDRFFQRTESLLAEILLDEGVRLPGERRNMSLKKAEKDGIEVPASLLLLAIEC